jgi:hypothetical protein
LGLCGRNKKLLKKIKKLRKSLDKFPQLCYNILVRNERSVKEMANKVVEMKTNKNGELAIPVSERAILVPIIKGLAKLSCDKVGGCEMCPFETNCGCALITVENELQAMLLREE